jgi:hypothetical protein
MVEKKLKERNFMIKTIILIILTLLCSYIVGWSIDKDNTAIGMTSTMGFVIFGVWLLGTALNGGL